MIKVGLAFNGDCRITLTSNSEQDRMLLGAALNNKTVKSINPVEGGFEIVLVEKERPE